jgi:hypothetical protein
MGRMPPSGWFIEGSTSIRSRRAGQGRTRSADSAATRYEKPVWASLLRDRKQRIATVNKPHNPINTLTVLCQSVGLGRLNQSYRSSWAISLEEDVKPGLPTSKDEVLLSVMPFEGPHQFSRPYVNRQSTGYKQSRPGGGSVRNQDPRIVGRRQCCRSRFPQIELAAPQKCSGTPRSFQLILLRL